MKYLKQFIKTTIREFLNEQNIKTEDVYMSNQRKHRSL